MKLGIIGIGHLGTALAKGYVRAGKSTDLIISPRSASRSAALHETYGIAIAETNDDVVRSADAVIVSVRPADMIETVRMLPWRAGQVAISVAAGVTAVSLRGAVTPADAVRAMPVMASAINESAVPVYPDNPRATAALSPLGAITLFDDEDAFNATSALGAWFAWLFQLLGETAETLESSGVDRLLARKVSADMMRAAGAFIAHDVERDPKDTVLDLATPGGISEIGLKCLKNADAFQPWDDAMKAAVKRLHELGASGD